MTVTPIRKRYWVVGGFIGVLLVLLVVVTAEVAHADPGKLSIAYTLQEKYPPRLTLQDRVGRVIRTGKTEFYPDISDELLRAGAQDAEHFSLLRELKLKSAVVAP